jgi:hypothetical protein
LPPGRTPANDFGTRWSPNGTTGTATAMVVTVVPSYLIELRIQGERFAAHVDRKMVETKAANRKVYLFKFHSGSNKQITHSPRRPLGLGRAPVSIPLWFE